MDTALVISGAAIIGTVLIVLFGIIVAARGWAFAFLAFGFVLTVAAVSLVGALLIQAGVA